ncbi:Hypothetical predicted protein [Olea europaea subsp. europaea]|uniref:Uncharacterized protein n=1 Tax=Olea europaea subsp. europaea TaxID=158383 RepID=A0A8S0PZM2_OLEEU|nr:Hypothetical predicted protein [Olea europaea subsp. europaea]
MAATEISSSDQRLDVTHLLEMYRRKNVSSSVGRWRMLHGGGRWATFKLLRFPRILDLTMDYSSSSPILKMAGAGDAFHGVVLPSLMEASGNGEGESGRLYTKDASRSWKLVGSDGSSKLVIKEPSANIVLLDYMSSKKLKDIIDCDNHLDDISK